MYTNSSVVMHFRFFVCNALPWLVGSPYDVSGWTKSRLWRRLRPREHQKDVHPSQPSELSSLSSPTEGDSCASVDCNDNSQHRLVLSSICISQDGRVAWNLSTDEYQLKMTSISWRVAVQYWIVRFVHLFVDAFSCSVSATRFTQKFPLKWWCHTSSLPIEEVHCKSEAHQKR